MNSLNQEINGITYEQEQKPPWVNWTKIAATNVQGFEKPDGMHPDT
jgi:hypothetical protein